MRFYNQRLGRLGDKSLKVLVTGGSGLLGCKVSEEAIKHGHEVYSGYNTHKPRLGTPVKLDICSNFLVCEAFNVVRPEVVIHTAALTDVDKCEVEKVLAWKVNVDGTRNVAKMAHENKSFLICVSTDYVFSGEKGMYKETDDTGPVNYYGVTKLEGEKTVKDSMNELCIARPSVIYGATRAGGKINFALWVIEKLEKKESVNIIMDQRISPTLNTNLADMILEIAERKLTGIYHLSGSTPISRYDFACAIAEKFLLNQNLIKPARSEELGWKARRPKDSSLNVDKASETLKAKPLKIEEALSQLKEELIEKSVE